ncbi:MAG TPA: hypothetical protein VN436_08570, partial [Holophaga sp.]|nr:hypothetical protein [Holophaga sp.]
MKGAVLLCLAGCTMMAALPLRLTSVDRVGLPPYEGSEKVYRVEGPACGVLRVGERLTLRRERDPRSVGQLEVLRVYPDHAETRLAASGETFPLKGDLVLRAEPLPALPEIPPLQRQS